MNAYPAICLIIILAIPLIWNLPISLIVSELALAMPTNEVFLKFVSLSRDLSSFEKLGSIYLAVQLFWRIDFLHRSHCILGELCVT